MADNLNACNHWLVDQVVRARVCIKRVALHIVWSEPISSKIDSHADILIEGIGTDPICGARLYPNTVASVIGNNILVNAIFVLSTNQILTAVFNPDPIATVASLAVECIDTDSIARNSVFTTKHMDSRNFKILNSQISNQIPIRENLQAVA